MSSDKVANLKIFEEYRKNEGEAASTRLLFSWLSDDDMRRQLYADMVSQKAALFFNSNASKRDEDKKDVRDFDWIDGSRDYCQKAVLLVHPDHVEQALTCSNKMTRGDLNHEKDQLDKLAFSNSPYNGLGGFFMLALDAPTEHDYQRDFALDMLQSVTCQQYDALSTLAFKAGALVPLKNHEFDLVKMAEDIAIRYAMGVFGFAQKDIALVQECTRKIGRGLQYQIMGRHFVFEPTTMIESRGALGKLAQRATEIIELFSKEVKLTRTEQDEKDEIQEDINRVGLYEFQIDASGVKRKSLFWNEKEKKGFLPILQKMAQKEADSKLDTEFGVVEKGLIAASLVGGSVTNIQNSICICLAEIFKLPPQSLIEIRKAAINERVWNRDAQWLPGTSKIVDLVKEAMRITPPVVFVPRRANRDVDLDNINCLVATKNNSNRKFFIKKDTLVLVALAGTSCFKMNDKKVADDLSSFRFDDSLFRQKYNATDSEMNLNCPYAKTFGGSPLNASNLVIKPPRWTYTHSCPGMMMAMNVIAYTVRQLLVLPSLAQRANPDDDGKPYGLEKRWGFQSTFYPLSYQKEQLLVQTPLQTVLPIRTPVDFHSQALRQVIGHGAPFIEKVLKDSNMVHFASFLFLDNDSKLILFTMYDGDFDTYIGHFAKEFGHLFDRFFEHVAVSPPMPIREHPFEFVQYLKQFVQHPVEGYYFSAYAEATTHKIVQQFTPQFDFNLIRGGR